MMRTIFILLVATFCFSNFLRGQETEKQPANVRELLEILRNTEGVYTWPKFNQNLNWVKDSDIPFLMELLDSKEECAHVVLSISSRVPREKSTVGHQAAYLIDGYWKRFFPVELSSDTFEPNPNEVKSWYQTWQRLRKGEQVSEAEVPTSDETP